MKSLKHPLRGRKAGLAAALSATAAIATATVMFVLADPAGAIPASQSGCEFNGLTITPQNNWVGFTAARTITVSSARTVKVEVTADVGVDAGAEVRLGYTVNGDAINEGGFGPANFANHQEFFESQATFALIHVGSGTTTITPAVRVNGPSFATATLLARCSTVEALAS